ncbi:SGLT6 [Mytilus edulis]|uniref:SLC5A11 n=1 Tax=Mytilus edulis TaxID=6550 RepID=A0A8S3S9P9_MYTED|nr:SGLT6 [Mytilus edulis]
MQNQSQLKQKTILLLPCQEIIQKDDSSGIQLHARPHVNDSLILPGIDNADKIAVKIETSQNDHLRLPHKDSVDSGEFCEDFDNIDDLRMKCQSNSTTPGSVNTPTFPCFAYKLQLHKKKNGKLKPSKQKEENQINDENNLTDRCPRYLQYQNTCLRDLEEPDLEHISVDVYAGSVFIQQALGWSTYPSIIGLLVITAVYTVIGGLAAVIFTDTLQTIIMLTGAISLSVLGFIKVGGINGLIPKYMDAIPDSLRYADSFNTSSNITSNFTSHCGYPRLDSFHIIRNPVDSDLPWPGLLIRSTFISTWYWCADQVIVQRALAAKNIGHARGATLMAGYLKFLPLFLIIMPGMISRVLFTEDVACHDPETCIRVCDNPVGCSNVAYPKLILGLAPTGLRGLMMAVMMSALMSSLTSIFNSAATLFTMDLWTKIRRKASDRELLIVGKVFIVILVGISVAWIPLIQNSQEGQLFLYIQAVTGYLAPPICSVFLLAVFVPRINEKVTA